MDLGSLIVTLGVDSYDIAKAEARYQEFAKSIDGNTRRMNSVLSSMSDKMRRFGREATVSLTLPLTLFGRQVFNTFRNYEKELAKITGLTGTAREQTMAWDQDIRNLAPAVALGPQKLVEAQYFIASSGIEASRANEVLEASAKAAASGLGEVNDIADLVTSALNAYKQQGITSTEVTDQLTAAVREGKQEADELAGAIGYVIPIASELGISFDQVAAAMAAMSETGTIATTAATNLRQMMADFLKPAKQSEEAMREMGFSSEFLRKQLREKGLLNTLIFLNQQTEKYGKNLSEVFPEVRGLTGVLSIVGENLEHNREIFAATANSIGDTENAFQEITRTLDFKWQKSVIEVQLGMIELGETLKKTLIPILESFNKRIRMLTEWFDNLGEGWQKTILYSTAFLALLGPLALGASVFVRSLQALVLVGGQVAKIMKFIVVAVGVSNPFTAAIIGAAALTAILSKLFRSANNSANAINKVVSEAEKLRKFNEEGNKAFSNIEDQIKTLDDANQRQLENLVGYIQRRIKIEEDAILKEVRLRKKAEEEFGETVEETRQNLRKSLYGYTALQQDATNRNLKIVQEYQEKVVQEEEMGANQRLEKLQDYLKQVQEQLESIKPSDQILPEGALTEEQQGAIDKYENGLKIIRKLSQLLGDDFNKLQELESLALSTLEDFVSVQLPDHHPKFQQIIQDLELFSSASFKAAGVFGELNKELEYLNKLEDIFGKNLSNEKIDAVAEALEKVAKNAEASSHNIQILQSMLQQLQNQQAINELGKQLDWVRNQEYLLGKQFDDTSAYISIYMNRLRDLTSTRQPDIQKIGETISILDNLIEKRKQETLQLQMQSTLYTGIANGVGQLSQAIGTSLGDAENSFQSLTSTILQSAQQITQALLVQAVTAAIAGETLRAGLVGGLIAATIGVSALLAAHRSAAAEAQSFGMAEGGIVPPGFPNDSYNARLTSGEMVIPPKKLPKDLGGMANNGTELVLTSEIQGEKLVFLLQKTLKRMSNRGFKINLNG